MLKLNTNFESAKVGICYKISIFFIFAFMLISSRSYNVRLSVCHELISWWQVRLVRLVRLLQNLKWNTQNFVNINLYPKKILFCLPLGYPNFVLQIIYTSFLPNFIPFDQKNWLKLGKHCDSKLIYYKQCIFRDSFYPREVEILHGH